MPFNKFCERRCFVSYYQCFENRNRWWENYCYITASSAAPGPCPQAFKTNQAMATADSIASCTRCCCVLFQQLREALESPKFEGKDQLSLDSFNVQSSRFDLWARNIAALHPAHLPSSLEHRIRDDEGARDIVRRALKYVEESLEIGKFMLQKTSAAS